MPESDWLNQNSHRFYPFVPSADFTTGTGTFDGKYAFADAGFTLGIASAFEHVRDHIYLERYYMEAGIIRFVFRLEYGATAAYEAMLCYEWVFEPDAYHRLRSDRRRESRDGAGLPDHWRLGYGTRLRDERQCILYTVASD